MITKEDVFMFDSKYSKLLTVLLVGGIILIVGILGIVGFIIARNGKLKQDAIDAVDQFQSQGKGNEIVNEVVDNEKPKQNTVATNEVIMPDIGIENIISNTITSDNNSNSNKKTYKGFPMAGSIEIPAINLKYPVLEDASADAIEVAVGIYDGPGLNEVGNTTIAGHNYRDGNFFSNNKKLVEGDKVHITDEMNRKVTYSIYKIYTTSPEDESHLDRDTEGRREITLVTCTDDTKSRLIICAKEQ